MSSSRETILTAIRRNKPEQSPLPEIPDFESAPGDLVASFTAMIEQAKGEVLVGFTEEELARRLAERYTEVQQVWSALPSLWTGNVAINTQTPPASLAGLDLAVVSGAWGVAENGAIWVPESSLPQRVVAFITQHLVIVLEPSRIVSNMHQAYQKLGARFGGFGVFIAGPSKTADIEQSLVIGAHGPKSLTVCLVSADSER